MSPGRLALYGELCGATLARAHARTGDAAKITGYLGDDDTFDRALERFAVAYADQNDADYAAFAAAEEDQRIEVERGV
jgi:sugar/nucleoside kinase (ribokinase family)